MGSIFFARLVSEATAGSTSSKLRMLMVTPAMRGLEVVSFRRRTFPEVGPVLLVSRRPRIGPRENLGPVEFHGDTTGRHADDTVPPRLRGLLVVCCANCFQGDQHIRVRAIGGKAAKEPLDNAVPG